MPFAYSPMAQEDLAGKNVSFIVHARNQVVALSALERTVREVAPELRPTGLNSLRPRLVSEQIEMVLAPQRFGATLLSGFALASDPGSKSAPRAFRGGSRGISSDSG